MRYTLEAGSPQLLAPELLAPPNPMSKPGCKNTLAYRLRTGDRRKHRGFVGLQNAPADAEIWMRRSTMPIGPVREVGRFPGADAAVSIPSGSMCDELDLSTSKKQRTGSQIGLANRHNLLILMGKW